MQAHGTGFAESLEKTPLPPHLAIDFPDAPEDDIAPNTIWTWVTWRLESLERADRRLQKLLDKCGNLVDQVMGYSVSREISIRPPSHSEKKKTINMKLGLLTHRCLAFFLMFGYTWLYYFILFDAFPLSIRFDQSKKGSTS